MGYTDVYCEILLYQIWKDVSASQLCLLDEVSCGTLRINVRPWVTRRPRGETDSHFRRLNSPPLEYIKLWSRCHCSPVISLSFTSLQLENYRDLDTLSLVPVHRLRAASPVAPLLNHGNPQVFKIRSHRTKAQSRKSRNLSFKDILSPGSCVARDSN